MRTTLTLDDDLYRRAMELADPGMDKAELLREAVRTFIRVQAGKRLAALGGAAPDMADVPRRRPAKKGDTGK
ncbi:MAG: type II toxin-antitoxin system VapB family antitoxin [Rubrivivax sp.]